MFLLFLTLFFEMSSNFDFRPGFTECQGQVWLGIPGNFLLKFCTLGWSGGWGQLHPTLCTLLYTRGGGGLQNVAAPWNLNIYIYIVYTKDKSFLAKEKNIIRWSVVRNVPTYLGIWKIPPIPILHKSIIAGSWRGGGPGGLILLRSKGSPQLRYKNIDFTGPGGGAEPGYPHLLNTNQE